MKIAEVFPDLKPELLEDGEVVGLESCFVLHFQQSDATVYNSGMTLDHWLDGHPEVWLLTEDEARRLGIDDYNSYCERIRAKNPALMGANEAAKP